MSWTEESRMRYLCPCGRGEYEEITECDDWNRTRCTSIMLCPDCKEKYVYSDEPLVPRQKGKEIEKGWILK